MDTDNSQLSEDETTDHMSLSDTSNSSSILKDKVRKFKWNNRKISTSRKKLNRLKTETAKDSIHAVKEPVNDAPTFDAYIDAQALNGVIITDKKSYLYILCAHLDHFVNIVRVPNESSQLGPSHESSRVESNPSRRVSDSSRVTNRS